MDADVLIAGGGIVGLSVAIALRQRGKTVVVVDPGSPTRRASYGNAGMINRASLFPLASPHVWRNLARYVLNRDPGLHLDRPNAWRVLPWLRRFLRSSNEASWRRAAGALDPLVAAATPEHRRLAKLAGAEALLDRTGWIRLYRSDEAFERSRLEQALLAEHGVPFEVFSEAAIGELEPALTRPFARAILFPEMTLVRSPGALIQRYERLLEELGGRFVRASLEALGPEDGGWIGRARGLAVAGRQAVISAGAWSGGLARLLGYKLPLAVERGYHLHFRPGNGKRLARPVYDPAGGCVVCPMNDGLRVLCGVELAPRDAPPHLRLISGAVAAAAAMASLGEQVEDHPWLGYRPSTPDGLPVIGLADRHQGLAFAFGHGHIGLSTGPITGQIVADLLCGARTSIPIESFSHRRFD
jgi:D-amino-acid dehydrogenase